MVSKRLSGNDDAAINEPSLYEQVYDMVCSIPEGKVASYGQIARLIGRPRHARHIGYALAALPDEHEVPWHRVVNSKGEISARSKAGYEDYQRILLEEEGVEFNPAGKIHMRVHLWEA